MYIVVVMVVVIVIYMLLLRDWMDPICSNVYSCCNVCSNCHIYVVIVGLDGPDL